jgi:hypothetical protein
MWNVFTALAMKAYKGSRGTVPVILNLGTRWRWMINFSHQPLYAREGTLVSVE